MPTICLLRPMRLPSGRSVTNMAPNWSFFGVLFGPFSLACMWLKPRRESLRVCQVRSDSCVGLRHLQFGHLATFLPWSWCFSGPLGGGLVCVGARAGVCLLRGGRSRSTTARGGILAIIRYRSLSFIGSCLACPAFL